MQPPWEGETKVCINGPDHMTKMATIHICGENLKRSCFLVAWNVYWVIIVCSNVDPRLLFELVDLELFYGLGKFADCTRIR